MTHGWTIIDAGLGIGLDPPLVGAGAGRTRQSARRRIVITHYHPDHIGASAELVALTGATEVVQGAHDAHLTELAWGEDADVDGFQRHLEIHGMPAEMAAQSTDAEERTPVHAAAPTRLVEPGDELDLDGEQFRVLLLPGHADGHIALHGAAQRTAVRRRRAARRRSHPTSDAGRIPPPTRWAPTCGRWARSTGWRRLASSPATAR